MQKIKNFFKKYMIGLTLSFLVCIVSVSAITYFDSKNVTYNNETTGMASTNVQDAVNELYSVCFPPSLGNSILDKVPIVSSGDGLYKDEYEDRYFYRGANPNNYITFNNETWRILSVECDGTIKIIKNSIIGTMQWDSSNQTNWDAPASLNTYLNESYLKTITINKEQIMSHTWSIGETKYTNDDLSEQINNENATQSKKHSVGMITSSEYLRTNSNKSQCKTELLLYDNSATCKTTTWLYNIVDGNGLWLISNSIRGILGTGNFAGMTNWYNSNNQNGVAPVLYLSSEVKITGGDGSQSNPYTIS